MTAQLIALRVGGATQGLHPLTPGLLALNYRRNFSLATDLSTDPNIQLVGDYRLNHIMPITTGVSGEHSLSAFGDLGGVHARSKAEISRTDAQGPIIRMGTSQGIPVFYVQLENAIQKAEALTAGNMTTPNQTQLISDLLSKAKELIGRHGYERDIIRLASRALAIGKNAKAYFIRARAAYDLGDMRSAIDDWSHALAIDNRSADSYVGRCLAKSELGDNYEAIIDCTRAIAIDPATANAYISRGLARYRLRDYHGAIADFNEHLGLNPKDSSAFVSRGDARADLGDKQGAIADYNHAISLNPREEWAYINRGITRAELGNNQGAITDCNSALSMNPRNAKAYFSRAFARERLGDLRGAIADYDKVLIISPRHINAYVNRGIAKSRLGDREGMCRDYKMAISLGDPELVQWLKSESGAWCRKMQ